MHVDFIRDASQWMGRLCTEEFAWPRPLGRADVQQALGEPVCSCDLWVANWRNRIYRVKLGAGRTMVAKQVCVPPYSQCADEYQQLAATYRLAIPGLTVPRPLALLPEQHAYVMELASGKTITALFRDANTRAEACVGCELAGQALARLHLAWAPSIVPAPMKCLTYDLEAMPGGWSSRQHDVLRHALDVVAGSTTAVGALYLDFKSENVLCAGNTLSLLDPPQARRVGVLRWDTVTFGTSLRWQLWKGAIGLGRRERSRYFDECLTRFKLGYRRQAPGLANQSATDPILLRLLELQQIGQLLAYQTGKLRLAARKRNPLAATGRFVREMATTLAWLPVLQMRKHSLVRYLAQLSSGTLAPGLSNAAC